MFFQFDPTPHRRTPLADTPHEQQLRILRYAGGITLVLCVAVGSAAYILSRPTAAAALPLSSLLPESESTAAAADSVPESGESAPAQSAAEAVEAVEAVETTESTEITETVENAVEETNSLHLTAAAAQAMLDDPLMVLVNHANKMPDGYTFETAECGSATAINKSLQTAACDAFLKMQAAAAADGVTVWMQSGYRSVEYQSDLYTRKTQYFINKGYDEATAKEKAATIVNPPGYSEHNCGLAADLNSPEHTGLDEGFENTEAFRWLSEHAGEYGFILRYPKDAEDITEVTYEPWHWRYVGAENAAKINASGLCFETYYAELQRIAAAG